MTRSSWAAIGQRVLLGVSLALLVVTVAVGGCAPPKPSAEALLAYFENVPIHGEVRRVWPAGQDYADKVLKAHAALSKTLDELAAHTTVLSLWPADDPRWNDTRKVDKHLEALEALSIGDKHKRNTLMVELDQALQSVPDGLGLDTAEARQAFVDKAWAALAPPGKKLHQMQQWLEALVTERVGLYKLAPATADRPAFSAVHQAFDGKLRARRDASISFAESRIRDINERMTTINKRQQRNEYDALFWERKFHRDALDAVHKDVYAALEATRLELKKLDQAKPDGQTKLRFLESHAQRLEAEHAALKTRISKILEQHAQGVAE